MDAELIQSDPAVMMGKPVVAGTRITVELILEKLSAGETIEQVLEAHPRLTRESVLAALRFAARVRRTGERPARFLLGVERVFERIAVKLAAGVAGPGAHALEVVDAHSLRDGVGFQVMRSSDDR